MATKKKVAKKKVAKKKVAKKKSKKIKALWDPWYSKMLNAVSEYIESIAERNDGEFNERDFRIVRALIEFYGFDPDADFQAIMEDLEYFDLYKEDSNH